MNREKKSKIQRERKRERGRQAKNHPLNREKKIKNTEREREEDSRGGSLCHSTERTGNRDDCPGRKVGGMFRPAAV